MSIVILDRQHSGKPDAIEDTGTSGDLNQNGRVDWAERESSLTLLYGHYYAAEMLRASGVDVIPISDGTYRQRHERVNGYLRNVKGPHIYVALHLNGSDNQSADYGSIFYDHRSAAGAGPRLATLIARALRAQAPELGDVRAVAASPKDWTKNAFHTIRDIGPAIAICYEPAFLTSPKHAPLLGAEGLPRVGKALAQGIISYLNEANS
jgi:N-acetylmuramoyl-L-alanine amidase